MILVATLVGLVFALRGDAAPTSVERFGVSSALAHPDISDVLRGRGDGYATVRQGARFGYSFAIAPGVATVEFGVSDFFAVEPGQRVFDVLANGAVACEQVDVVTGGGSYPGAFEHSFTVDVPSDGKLELVFVGRNFEAMVSWVRVVDGAGSSTFIDCGALDDAPSRATRAELGEAVIATHGSRFFLDLRPQWREVLTSPLGLFGSEPRDAALGFIVDGTTYSLPLFRDRRDWRVPEGIREERSATGVVYHVPLDGYDATIALHAPFHPGDRELWGLPVIVVDFAVTRSDPSKPARIGGAFHLRHESDANPRTVKARRGVDGVVAARERDGRTIEYGMFAAAVARADRDVRRLFFEARDGFISSTLLLDTSAGPAHARVLFVGFDPGPTLDVEGVPHELEYARRFGSIEAVASHAAKNDDALLRGAKRIDALFADPAWPSAVREFAAYALPSFALNTVWTRGRDGAPFASVTEGYCRYHSTLDVAYNASAWMLWFAPDLLRHDLLAWPRFMQDDVFPHDIGIDERVLGPEYSHQMPVEENTNFVLLLHAFTFATGDVDLARALHGELQAALRYVEQCDADGDSLPDQGTANTLDDAPAAVQFAHEQTYLAVKCAAAFEAGAALSALLEDPERAEAWRTRAATIARAVEDRAFAGTHYVAAIDASTQGLEDPWGRPLWRIGVDVDAACVPGGDQAHPYTTVGLPWLWRAGGATLLDPNRMRIDLATAAHRAATRFGTAHGERSENLWVSQNLFRDASAAYLGVDVLDRFEGYVALQRDRARELDRRLFAGFCDSPFNRALSYYPRGMAFLLTLEATAGMRLDRIARTLTFKPVRVPFALPLPLFADWKAGRVPRFVVERAADGTAEAHIEHSDRLDGLTVTIDLTLVGGGVRKL
ncbi:MAG: DUF4965 domain-containing protein [Planctomycetes bacterium]|nr:DUF4965 domain-containing protein [Planctomycetota bacterium]MCC7169164.1 DUF4965 domain-containing protein [Planctomycetota bacterium]